MIDKIFQVLYILIMAFGILGLPLYFWLYARKKRLLQEYESAKTESPSGEDESDNKDEESDNITE